MSHTILSAELTNVLDAILKSIPENLDTAFHSSVSVESKTALKLANDSLKKLMDQLGGEFSLSKRGLHLKMGRYAPHGRYKPYIWGAFIPNTVKAPSHLTPQMYVFRSSQTLGWGLCPSDKARNDSMFMSAYKKVLNENKLILEELLSDGFVGRDAESSRANLTSVEQFLGSTNVLLERSYPTANLPSDENFLTQLKSDFNKLLPLYQKIIDACASNDLLETSTKNDEEFDLVEKWDNWFYEANDVAQQQVPDYLQAEIGLKWKDLSHVWEIGRREALKAVELARSNKSIPEESVQALLFGRLRRTAFTGEWRNGVKHHFAKVLIEIDNFVKSNPEGCVEQEYDSLISRLQVICGYRVESFATRLMCDLAPNVYLPYGKFTVPALRAAAKLLGQISNKNLSEKNYVSMCDEAKRLCAFAPELPVDEKLYVFDHFLYWVNLELYKETPKLETAQSDAIVHSSSSTKYWKISAGTAGSYASAHKTNKVISIGWGEVSDPRQFDSIEKLFDAYKKLGDGSYDPGHASRQCWTFCNEIKKGDYIFGYGPGAVIMVGIDQGIYDFKDVKSWSGQDTKVSSSHRHIRSVKWLPVNPIETTRMSLELKKKIERRQAIISLSVAEGEEILKLAGLTEGMEALDNQITNSISLNELCDKSLKPQSFFETLERRLLSKRQVVFFGPPGTSKTHIAKHFANWFAEGGQVASVQFHPSYAYEDFIEGFRPANDSSSNQFKLDTGIFKQFCNQAMSNQSTRYVFIIDEINRGNLPQIFGELLHLLEYRNEEVTLPYSKSPFVIPENVYLVATMNSADRSIAMVDYALRRRFEFFSFPADAGVLEQFLKGNDCNIPVKKVVSLFEKLNTVISQELGKHYQVGHTYFMKPQMTEDVLRDIWSYSVLPLLEEYFFDNPRALEALQFENLWAKEATAA